jgi:hypothetical protein
MQLKLTALAGAAALALTSGYASAQLIPMSTGNSEVWFSVWDPVRQASYTRDLGFFQNTLTTASVAGQTGVIENTNGLSMQFGPEALLTQFLADSADNLDKLRWNVAGGDGTGVQAGNRRIIVTAAESVTKTQIQVLAGQQMFDMISAANSYVNAVNSNTLGTHQTLTNGSHIEVVGDSLGNDASYAGGAFWGTAFGSNGNFMNAGGLGDSLNFWWLAQQRRPQGHRHPVPGPWRQRRHLDPGQRRHAHLRRRAGSGDLGAAGAGAARRRRADAPSQPRPATGLIARCRRAGTCADSARGGPPTGCCRSPERLPASAWERRPRRES